MAAFEQFDNVSVTLGLTSSEAPYNCYMKIVEGITFIGNYENVDYTISPYELASVVRMSDSTLCQTLKIKTKYFLCFTICFADDKDTARAQITLLTVLQNSSYAQAVAFYPVITTQYPPVQIFDLAEEYSRMGIPNAFWRVCDTLNREFKLCSTYPEVLAVPRGASDKIIRECATFRSRNRIPVLCYYHRDSMTSLCRSSQPLLGLNNRNESDERLLEIIGQCSDSPKPLLVVDTRPKINAIANRAGGKGYELKQFYPHIDFVFKSIENIHVMRNSLNKLLDVIEQNGSHVEAISSSMWFTHLQAIIDCSVFIAQQLVDGSNVLAHCSDGWDRTSQTCALATLMLDPYHRTIEGFWTLIEREWLAFGHQFATRCGHFSSTADPKFVSPVFVQFMDCVWQIYMQFPHIFEFDDKMLIFIIQHSFSCCFGEFLYNSPNERNSAGLFSRSIPSLYSYIKYNIPKFYNKLYNPDQNDNFSLLKPNSDPRILQLWTQLYVNGGRPSEGTACLNQFFEKALEDEVRLLVEKDLLEKEIRDLVSLRGVGKSKELILGMNNEDVDVFDCLNF